MTRSVRDSAALLDETAGPVAGDFHRVMPDADNYLEACYRAPRPLRIGFTTRAPSEVPVHADCVAAVEKTVKLLQALGHQVEEKSPDYSAMDLAYHSALMGMAFVRAEIQARLQQQGRALQADDLEVATHSLLEVMQHSSATDYATALKYLNHTSRQAALFYQRYDLWLTSTLAQPPAKLGHLFCDKPEDALGLYEKISAYTPFTGFANGTGLPAMSVPLHWNAAGLPIGVQFVGRAGEEALMFALAAQLENAQPWGSRYSSLPVKPFPTD